MTTLENLYYGNIAPHEYEVVRGSEYDITAKLVIRHEQELSATLTEQQNVILQKIKDNHTELMNLGERDAFCRGVFQKNFLFHNKEKSSVFCGGSSLKTMTLHYTESKSALWGAVFKKGSKIFPF